MKIETVTIIWHNTDRKTLLNFFYIYSFGISCQHYIIFITKTHNKDTFLHRNATDK